MSPEHVIVWARERLENSKRLAETKCGVDRVGWLSDVDMWREIVALLRERNTFRCDLNAFHEIHRELQDAHKRLKRWHDDVVVALRRGEKGGTFYADVPSHVRALVDAVDLPSANGQLSVCDDRADSLLKDPSIADDSDLIDLLADRRILLAENAKLRGQEEGSP